MDLDRERFEILVKEQRGNLLAYLMAVYGANRNDAEDAIQDAWPVPSPPSTRPRRRSSYGSVRG